MGFIDDLYKVKRDAEWIGRVAENLEQGAQSRQLDAIKSKFDQSLIGPAEFERQIVSQTGNINAPILLLLEDVDGLGKKTSEAIAWEYNSVEDFIHTDRDRLTSIRGVGDTTADKILQEM